MTQQIDHETTPYGPFLTKQLSRRTLFKAAGATGLGLMLAQAGLLREAAAASETVQDILNVAITVEHFGLTFLGFGIANIKQGKFSKPVPVDVLAVLEAARAQEKFHLDFFAQAGAVPLTTTFTLPDPALITDYDKFFTAVVEQETRETALGIAAMAALTALQRPDVVKIIFQYTAEESEHRVLANYALGTRPANDHGFAPALYTTASDIVADLKKVGIIGGSGSAIVSPGPGTVDPTNVIERVPGGAVVACAAAPGTTPAPAPSMPGLPNTGGGGGTAHSENNAGLLSLLGVGAVAMGALALRRSRQSVTVASEDKN